MADQADRADQRYLGVRLPLHRLAWAGLPFVLLALVLKQVPDASSRPHAMPWSHAGGNAILLLALLSAHVLCYPRWHPFSAKRVALNELLARLWFVAFGFLVVAIHPGGPAFLFAAAGTSWALLAWLTHLALVKRTGGYPRLPSLALWGVFLLGLALLGEIALGNQLLARP